MTTAFLFPGLDALRRADDLAALHTLPEFASRWHVLGAALDVHARARVAAALREGHLAALFARDAIVGGALAIVALQTASAAALERRGCRAQWVCGYSLGDVARAAHARCFSLEALADFVRVLPRELPFVEGVTMAATGAGDADELASASAGLAAAGLAVSRLSPRLLTFAGPRASAEDAARDLRSRRWRTRELIGCVLHAPEQSGLATLLHDALQGRALAAPDRAMESAVLGVPIDSAARLREELAVNPRAPCDFASAIERLRTVHGVTRFIDIGPGRSAQRLLRHFDPPIEASSALDILASA
jgi:acyl transferase domain-containing protein